MPSLTKLKGTRKRHLYYRRRMRQEDVAPLHALYRAEGRIASLGWAYCGSCGHTECWLSLPWFNDDVACSCGGSVGIAFRPLRPQDAAWRDRKGVVHIVEIDHGRGTITACRQPIEQDQHSLHAFVYNATPSCLWCAGGVTMAA